MKKILIIFLLLASVADATRIKDIAYVKGVNDYQVIGYGLVVGLNGTGDSQISIFTEQSVASMLKRFGITVAQSQMRMRNVAAVMVVASIPPFLEQRRVCRCDSFVDGRCDKFARWSASSYGVDRAGWESLFDGARSAGGRRF